MGDTKEQHILALKVMRLTKPSLVNSTPLTCEQKDVPNAALMKSKDGPDGHRIAIEESLILPQSSGNIFLGETFSSYVIVHNDSDELASNVLIKAELQTGSTRVLVSDPDSVPKPSLDPGHLIDCMVTHEVKELGVHILVCSVQYINAADERKFFRKFFKFQVLKPLDVKTKAYNVESDIYLEAQIQNIMPSPMFLHSVALQPAAEYTSEDLSTMKLHKLSDDTPEHSQVFGELAFLNSQDSRQYLYRLSPKSDLDTFKPSNVVGKLEVIWKTNLGEQGRLQTSQLSRKPPPARDIEVKVLDICDEAVCGKSFPLKLSIRNMTSADMDLRVKEEPTKEASIFLDGLSGSRLGVVGPMQAVTISLRFVAFSAGVHLIQGLSLFDSISVKAHPLVPLPSVYVVSPDEFHLQER
eukprot:m.339839 g.339839  ORF g.339839 m.339839 type:complete len:411 (+) comp18997_c0_seq1:210-1442(+)